MGAAIASPATRTSCRSGRGAGADPTGSRDPVVAGRSGVLAGLLRLRPGFGRVPRRRVGEEDEPEGERGEDGVRRPPEVQPARKILPDVVPDLVGGVAARPAKRGAPRSEKRA